MAGLFPDATQPSPAAPAKGSAALQFFGAKANRDAGAWETWLSGLEPKQAAAVRDAYAFAQVAHAGAIRHFDKQPYFTHPRRVAQTVQRAKGSPAQVMAALLHDTIEDTGTTRAELAARFGDEVATLVQELTSNREQLEKVGKTAYLSAKMNKMSPQALLVKLADRLDNVSDFHLQDDPQLDDSTRDAVRRFAQKYAPATLDILSALKRDDLSAVQRDLISQITARCQAQLSRAERPSAGR